MQFAAFWWGFGTALGELPPYFVARAASLSGKRLEDIDSPDDYDDSNTGELDSGKTHKEPTFFQGMMGKMKNFVDFALGRFAFLSIMLMASVSSCETNTSW